MSTKKSIAGLARREIARDTKLRQNAIRAVKDIQSLKLSKKPMVNPRTVDSFVNFAQMLGVGADNALSTSSYGFNPITRVRTQLEWIHRGSWLGGVAVDIVAEDMTRAGVEFASEVSPDNVQKITECMNSLGVWQKITETIKWARLYGGCIAVMMIDGQKMDTPLRLETIGPDQFKGLMVLDRWMVDPSLNDLVNTPGPDLGLPKFYTVNTDAPALNRQKIHHTRCLRLTGIDLPYWQRVMENLWGISVIERLYDRMIAFDSATTGAAQLVYKAYIRTYKVKGLREIVASGGQALRGLAGYVELMRRFQGQEGITMLDAEDEMEAMQAASFSGLSDALLQFGQQLSGALQVPLVRLFGQSPAGLNSTGESDLRMYYDGIKQKQDVELKTPVTRIIRAVAQSKSVTLPEGFSVEFRSLWQLTEEQKAQVASTTVDAVTKAEDSGILSQKASLKELKQSSKITGIFSNITQMDIDAAEESLPPAGAEALNEAEELGLDPTAVASLGEGPGGGSKGLGRAAKLEKKVAAEEEGDGKLPEKSTPGKKDQKDSLPSTIKLKTFHDLDVVIENDRGAHRFGKDWEVSMPADYGYLRKTRGADEAEIDCYVGPNPKSTDVWVIDQCDPNTQQFDEEKVLLGYNSIDAALKDYLLGYSDGRGWERIQNIKRYSMDEFKTWLKGKSS